MGRFEGLVAQLERCAEVGREAFEGARAADQDVTAADLTELTAALARVDRAVQAASVAAVAQFARREEVPDPQDVAAVVERVHPVGFVEEFASTEVAMTLGVSTRTADARVEQAAQLASRLPRVLAQVASGAVELGQAGRVLHESAEIEDLALVHAIDGYVAARIGTTDPTRLGALTRYAIARTCPQALRQRAAKNQADRTLDLRPGPAGLAEVYALVPAAHAAAIWEAAGELARGYLDDDPALTLDQARADAFVDLALGNVHVSATVNLGVPVLSSIHTGLGDNPTAEPDSGHSTGTAPGVLARDLVCAKDAEEWEHRRDIDHDPWYTRHTGQLDTELAAASAPSVPGAFAALAATECSPTPWSAVAMSGVHLPQVGYVPPDVVASLVAAVGTKIGLAILDANTGTLLQSVREAYRPDAAMRHFITIRDQRCRMFGCQQRAEHWDLDHAVPHPDGKTTPTNLSGLCRRHHRAKQRRHWRYHLMPDGVALWTSPTGTTRVTYPEHHLPRPPDPPPPPVPALAATNTQLDDEPPF